MPVLPPELWSNIAGTFHSSESSSLYSLALVSSAQRGIAQAQLYHTVMINDRRAQAWMNIVNLLRGGEPAEPRPMEQNPDWEEQDSQPYNDPYDRWSMGAAPQWSSNDILDDRAYKIMQTLDEFPHLGRYVKNFNFAGDPNGEASQGAMAKLLKHASNVGEQPSLELTLFPVELIPFSRIDEITIMEAASNSRTYGFRVTKAIAANPTSLKTLHIFSYKPGSFEVFIRFDLHKLTSLETLSLSPTTYTLKKIHSDQLKPVTAKLVHLQIDAPFQSFLLPYTTSSSHDSLERLAIQCDEEVLDLSPFTHLTHLTIEYLQFSDLKKTLSTLSSTSLRSFKLKKMLTTGWGDPRECKHEIEQDLFELLPNSLVHLDLDYGLSKDGEGTYLGVKAALEGGRWPGLKMLEMRLKEEGEEEEEAEMSRSGSEMDEDEEDWGSVEGSDEEEVEDGGEEGEEEDGEEEVVARGERSERETTAERDVRLLNGPDLFRNAQVQVIREPLSDEERLWEWEDELRTQCMRRRVKLIWKQEE